MLTKSLLKRKKNYSDIFIVNPLVTQTNLSVIVEEKKPHVNIYSAR